MKSKSQLSNQRIRSKRQARLCFSKVRPSQEDQLEGPQRDPPTTSHDENYRVTQHIEQWIQNNTIKIWDSEDDLSQGISQSNRFNIFQDRMHRRAWWPVGHPSTVRGRNKRLRDHRRTDRRRLDPNRFFRSHRLWRDLLHGTRFNPSDLQKVKSNQSRLWKGTSRGLRVRGRLPLALLK